MQKLFFCKKFKVIHINAQSATNKLEELALMCGELKPGNLEVSENGFKLETVEFVKTSGYESAYSFNPSHFKGKVWLYLQKPNEKWNFRHWI